MYILFIILIGHHHHITITFMMCFLRNVFAGTGTYMANQDTGGWSSERLELHVYPPICSQPNIFHFSVTTSAPCLSIYYNAAFSRDGIFS